MQRQNLINVYDCINRIARNHERNGKDRSKWFYSDAAFNAVKNDKRNTIL